MTKGIIQTHKLPMHNFRFQTSSNKGVTAFVHVTGTTLEVKKKLVIPTTSLDQFQKQQGIVIGDERKQVNQTIADIEYMHAPSIHEHNKGLDDLEDQE
ncbi:hypothetical protein H5410_027732 [Solanum commersonii]|uniref:Uncharacterized protein n=1 Tax=Solanum commersonii TaxID=4109 RepID=A0A9J5Z2Q7_SOLCO|nr:hypothetical protein H5410_027732 [Solanum commersonii]